MYWNTSVLLIDTLVNAEILAFVNEHDKVKLVLVLVKSVYDVEEFDSYILIKIFCILTPPV